MLKKLLYLVLSIAVLAGCHKAVITEHIGNVSFDMIYVKGGTFPMGATAEQEDDYDSDEKPVHEVRLSDYYIGKYEVTQGLWKAVMGTTLEHQGEKAGYSNFYGVGDNYPMYYVNWEEALEFCTRLSWLTGRKYALPTEAQWEYAARGGEKSQGYKYSGGNDIGEVAWHYTNSERSTHPVGTKKANELGIYDMSGNVWEWCQDWYVSDYYSNSPQTNPTGPENGSKRVLRGGSWISYVKSCQVLNRNTYYPSYRENSNGFRLVLLP